MKNVFLCVLAVAAIAFAPHEAAACRNPSNKVAAISVALEKATLTEEKRARITALRDKAREWNVPGKSVEANAAADQALKLLNVQYREPPSNTRC
jgi:hypothetical protein